MPDEITIESLQAELKAMQAETKKTIEALTAQNTTLVADNDKWKAKRAEAEKHLKKQEEVARKAEEDAAFKSGDMEAIRASAEAKIAEAEARTNSVIQQWGDDVVRHTAKNIASDITMAGFGDFMSPLIEKRLSYDYDGEKMNLNVLDTDGKASIKTKSDLETEFSENKDFEKIVKGSSANGNGMAGNGEGSGVSSVARVDFEAMSQSQRTSYIKDGGTVHD